MQCVSPMIRFPSCVISRTCTDFENQVIIIGPVKRPLIDHRAVLGHKNLGRRSTSNTVLFEEFRHVLLSFRNG
jgi:hypothetical protein